MPGIISDTYEYGDIDFSDSEDASSGTATIQNSSPHSDDAEFLAKAFGQLGTGLHVPFKTVPELWLDSVSIDNVILQVDDHLFRVPPYLFLAKSAVFKDFYEHSSYSGTASHLFSRYTFHVKDAKMLQVLGPAPSIIIMLGVTATEAAYFLSALYDPEYFESPPYNPYEGLVDLIHAIFKLASLYEVKYLRYRALAHLELAYPSRIDDWDSRSLRSTIPVEHIEFHLPISASLTATFNTIELCVTYNAPWILPSAFYECCLYQVDTLHNHPKWKTGGSLSDEIRRMIMRGYAAHPNESSRILAFLHEDNPDCNNDPVCSDIRRKELSIRTARERENQDFLGKVWDSSDWDEFVSQGICDDCLSSSKSLHSKFRQAAWDYLPTLYDLPSWTDLLARR